MTHGYFSSGNGLLLPDATKQLYLNVACAIRGASLGNAKSCQREATGLTGIRTRARVRWMQPATAIGGCWHSFWPAFCPPMVKKNVASGSDLFDKQQARRGYETATSS
jgi:hypothetical protein